MTKILTEIGQDLIISDTFKAGATALFNAPAQISAAGVVIVAVGPNSIGWFVPDDALAALNEAEQYEADQLTCIKLKNELMNGTAGAVAVAVNDFIKVDASGTYVPVTEGILVTDDDNAASTGVAIYAHTNDGTNSWLEFVSPTNANGTGTLTSGGSAYFILDSDAAATGGLIVYFDEDATNVDERFLIVSPSAQDLKVKLDDDTLITLKHDASAASNGVQVYFDEDAASTFARMMFVSPTDTDGTGKTGDGNITINTEGIAVTAASAAGLFRFVRL